MGFENIVQKSIEKVRDQYVKMGMNAKDAYDLARLQDAFMYSEGPLSDSEKKELERLETVLKSLEK